ncbi:elongation factor G [Rhodopila sp.]|uniref:elongation factor G n=1 Tax=Rhodopila sp. TaxID=2480087 RepID=UPI002C1371EC|nr:elongation factor G [Rhodopila sp.]HVZ07994.1 elongation factor G [Rhodopila sp.]
MPEARNVRSPRAVALVGPYSSGKSCLFEAMLEAAGAPVKRPADPRNRPATTEIRVGHCTYLEDAWAVLDCPGSIEFAFETNAALAVADIAVVVCEPNPAKAATIAPLMKMLRDEGIPHLLFINKIDTLDAGLAETLAALQAQAGAPLVLRQMPIMRDNAVAGYVDLMSERAYQYRKGQASELIQIPAAMLAEEQDARGRLLETLADHDDTLLEKLLEDVKPTPEEIYRDMHKDLLDGSVVEVLLGCAENAGGVRRLWKTLRHDTPEVNETADRKSIDAGGQVVAQVFKTAYAGHTGKLSYARVWYGTIADGAQLNGNRLGGVYRFVNGDLAKVPEAKAGEVVALGRLETVTTGATLSANGSAEALPFPEATPPVYALAITTTDRKDDVKLSGALQKLVEEDPSLFVTQEQETVLHGQGEMHLQATIAHLAKAFGLKVNTHKPQVAYKETIRKPVHEHGRLKRQTGGHGQFADVKIDVAPRHRGEGFAFVDKIVGGAVPRNFIPAVGDAAEEATQKGPFGYPVVDIAVTLVDGGFHAVDSSDMAFKTATQIAMKEALAKADPVLLEPVDRVTVSVPNDYTARAQRLLTGRRGQILGFAERAGWAGWDDVEALVPEAELHDLIIELRSQTMGLGTFRKRFDHLAETKLAP